MVGDISLLRIPVAFLVLIYASRMDWKYREIDDRSWISLVIFGILFTLYDYFRLETASVVIWFLVSVAIAFALSFALSWLGLMAEGDAFILFGIGALFPHYMWDTLSVFPFFILSVFTNAVMLSALIPVAFFIKNLPGVKDVRSLKELFALFIGYRKRASEVKEFESIFGIGGEFKFLQNANTMELGKKDNLNKGDTVWVTPALPFVIPITLGLLLALYFGDIATWIVLEVFP